MPIWGVDAYLSPDTDQSLSNIIHTKWEEILKLHKVCVKFDIKCVYFGE